MARINFDVVMKDLRGNGLRTPVGPEEDAQMVPLTLSFVAAEALAFLDPQARESGEQKLAAGELAMRVYKGGKIELTAEDIVLLKKKIAVIWGPLVVAQAYRALESPMLESSMPEVRAA